MDQVKASYIEKIKSTSHLHSSSIPAGSVTTKISYEETKTELPLLEEISKQGWALPKRQFYRYNLDTKILLFELFNEGEESYLKKTPEQAAMIVRNELHDFVEPEQIQTLFSTSSQQKRNGTLKPPTKDVASASTELTPLASDVEKYDEDANSHLAQGG